MSAPTEEEFAAEFSSVEAKGYFDKAVDHLMALTGSDDLWRARTVVSGISAYVHRSQADQMPRRKR